MIIILFEIQLTRASKGYTSARVWVNHDSHESAEDLATRQLVSDGCSHIRAIENTTTHKDDYFAPCTSLDAFIRAEQEGISVLYA